MFWWCEEIKSNSFFIINISLIKPIKSPRRWDEMWSCKKDKIITYKKYSETKFSPLFVDRPEKKNVETDSSCRYKEGTLRKEKLRLLVDCSGCKDVVQVLIFQRNKLFRNINVFMNRKARSVNKGGENQRPDKTINGSNKIKFDIKFNEELAREDYVKNISSQNEKLDPNRPFLVVHTEPVVMKRSRRRALDCSGTVKGQCCKQNFFVSFKELKWDDWIIAPKGYHANYCRGDCGGIHRTPDTFLNYHTHVIEEYRKMDRLSGIQPCCAPVKFSSMTLIYFGPDNNIIKRDLPKMVVEQCGCPWSLFNFN